MNTSSLAKPRKRKPLRKARAELRAAFGREYQAVFRELLDLVRRTRRRKRTEAG